MCICTGRLLLSHNQFAHCHMCSAVQCIPDRFRTPLAHTQPASERRPCSKLSRSLCKLQMHKEARYHEMLFISDTCQAASLYGSIQAPHILSMASSKIGNLPLPVETKHNLRSSWWHVEEPPVTCNVDETCPIFATT